MPTLHICNANFEWELTQKKILPLAEILQKPPGNQLQFLPCLYANPEDGLVVTQKEPPWPNPLHMHLIGETDFSRYVRVESWGASPSVAAWAKEKAIAYSYPNWDVVKEVNSKAFSFVNSPALPGAELLFNEQEAATWCGKQKRPVVFKTCFGVSGTGHLIQQTIDVQAALTFMQKEWREGRPVIAEPWVERVLDFSTQWMVGNDKIDYLGHTLLLNDARGRFRQNRVSDAMDEIHLDKHREIALGVLKKIASRGYFGNVGIDAMLYKDNEHIHLHPIVEVNARKTMGFVALMFQQRHFPNEIVTFSFSPKNGLSINTETR